MAVMMKFYLVLCVTAVVLARWTTKASNETLADDDDDDDDDDNLEDINFEDFKRSIRRYRRLIPYMSYYVANNYVNNAAAPLPQTYIDDQPSLIAGQLPRKPQRIPAARPAELPPRIPMNSRATTLLKPERFVPSVQYDPKQIGADNDYFTPVRYSIKANYDKYYDGDYERRSPYTEITNQPVHDNNNNRYYIKERLQPLPARPQTPAYNPAFERDQPKQVTHLHPDYLAEYLSRPKQTDYYPIDDFESVRYVKIEPPLSVYHDTGHVIAPVQRRPIYQHKSPAISEENIIKSLQLTNQLPEMLNRDNIDSSIKTLVEILSLLHGVKHPEPPRRLADPPLVQQSAPSYKKFVQQYSRPKVITETQYQATPSPNSIAEELVRLKPTTSKPPAYSDYETSTPKSQSVIQYYVPLVQDIDGDEVASGKLQNVEQTHQNSYEITEDVDEHEEKPTKSPTTSPSPPVKHYQLAEGLDEHEFSIPTMPTNYGVTRGKPNVDYPIYSAIPQTDFNCKAQRYKGFFGDPSTRCQVWHYCDLNGGKSSFLCPNGTIFSQIALTCDWWFNVKCESTTQLYVLNERLYKFILPIMPKFPEDFSGPEVDRYLELKFEEMEAKLKAKKLKLAMEKKAKTTKTQASVEEK